MSNRGRKFPVEVLTPDEFQRLLRKARGAGGPCGRRNAALLVVGYRAGLRVSEALALVPRDLDLRQCTINVRRGKGSKQRIVGIDPEACAVLARWLDARGRRRINPLAPLFCTIKSSTEKSAGLDRPPFVPGEPLKPSYVRSLMKRLARQAGVCKRVHFHALRHSMAAELVNENTPVNMISKQLGHSSIATTAVYLDHVNPQAVIDVMRSRSWSAEPEMKCIVTVQELVSAQV